MRDQQGGSGSIAWWGFSPGCFPSPGSSGSTRPSRRGPFRVPPSIHQPWAWRLEAPPRAHESHARLQPLDLDAPDRSLEVGYESLVEDATGTIDRVIQGPACRPTSGATASRIGSGRPDTLHDQVRRPMNSSGIGRWAIASTISRPSSPAFEVLRRAPLVPWVLGRFLSSVWTTG